MHPPRRGARRPQVSPPRPFARSASLGLALALTLSALACGGEPVAPPPATPAPPPAPAPPKVEPDAGAEKAPEPTPEEKKKAEALVKLKADWARADAEAKTELERWTPELRAAAKALAEKRHANLKAALAAVLPSKHRAPRNVARDAQRHPAETLTFFGLTPRQTVLEYGPGEGWYTEILAPIVAAQGKLVVTNTDPNGSPEQRSTFYGHRFKLFLDKSPELFGKTQVALIDGATPRLDLEGKVDLALVLRGLHGMQNSGKLDAWLAEIHKALKMGGTLGIEQHRAKAGAKAEETSKQGYLPEAWVIERIEAAGFKFAGKSEVNANPKDTKDYAEGVWTLPPTLTLKDVDRAKYEAIGESDRMTLKFSKIAKVPAKPKK